MTKTPLLLQKERYQICIYLKSSLILKKKVYSDRGAQKMTKFCIYSKRPPLTSKKALHLLETPLLLEKKQLLPQEAHKLTKFLYLF